MLAIFMNLIRTARQAPSCASDERGPAPIDGAGESFLDAEALLLRLGMPREFTA